MCHVNLQPECLPRTFRDQSVRDKNPLSPTLSLEFLCAACADAARGQGWHGHNAADAHERVGGDQSAPRVVTCAAARGGDESVGPAAEPF
eukprot:360019-Chlamydomonas_euryale.AAC.23